MPKAKQKDESVVKRDKLELFNEDTLEVVRLARIVHNSRSQQAIDRLTAAVADLPAAGQRRRAELDARIAEREETKRQDRSEADRIAAEEVAKDKRLAADAQRAAEGEAAAVAEVERRTAKESASA